MTTTPGPASTSERLSSIVRGERAFGASVTLDINPTYPEATIAEVSQATEEIADRAIAAAYDARRTWLSTPPFERSAILHRVAELLREREEAIGRDMAREMGKTIGESRGEVRRAAQVFQYFAGQVLEPDGETYPASTAGTILMGRRVPLGVVSVITPWNFPLAIPAWKIAPALAYGNTVVWKPADIVPLTSTHLILACLDAGLPEGVLSLLIGRGSVVGKQLVSDPRVSGLTFTGSNEVGRGLLVASAHSGIRVQLELGGKNPAIVLADADLELAASSVARAAFLTTGQKCTATSRVIVEKSVRAEFSSLLASRADAMKIGDPLDPSTEMGPLASHEQFESVESFLRLADSTAVFRNARRSAGVDRGYFVTPTVLDGMTADSPLIRSEIFGPVVSLIEAESYEHAVVLANDTEFGLSASLYTNDLRRAIEFADSSETGLVKVNQETSGVDFVAPFGGQKASGFGSQEQGKAAREFFTHWKSVYLSTQH
jgi:acyl-CoA reductase-like NAD-dependent aldehyde dehydrogenase